MKYLIVDGMLNGTGIRDKYEGGYISLETLSLPNDLISMIKKWLTDYEQQHYSSFSDTKKVQELDAVGIEISKQVKSLLDAKVTYFSSATMKEQEV